MYGDQLWAQLDEYVASGDEDEAKDSVITFLIEEVIDELTLAAPEPLAELEAAIVSGPDATDHPVESLEALFELPAYTGEDH